MYEEFRNVILEDLDGVYSTVSELKQDIEHLRVPKKKFAKKKQQVLLIKD